MGALAPRLRTPRLLKDAPSPPCARRSLTACCVASHDCHSLAIGAHCTRPALVQPRALLQRQGKKSKVCADLPYKHGVPVCALATHSLTTWPLSCLSCCFAGQKVAEDLELREKMLEASTGGACAWLFSWPRGHVPQPRNPSTDWVSGDEKYGLGPNRYALAFGLPPPASLPSRLSVASATACSTGRSHGSRSRTRSVSVRRCAGGIIGSDGSDTE